MKQCSVCKKEFRALWKSKTREHGAMCAVCWRNHKMQEEGSDGLKLGKVTMYSMDKYKKRKTTGEWALFCKIYAERKGLCQITGLPVRLEPSAFAHVLSKGAFPSYRLNPENIVLCLPDIHHYYDNSDKETLLKHYPEAYIIYQLKDKLRYEYYNGKRDSDLSE